MPAHGRFTRRRGPGRWCAVVACELAFTWLFALPLPTVLAGNGDDFGVWISDSPTPRPWPDGRGASQLESALRSPVAEADPAQFQQALTPSIEAGAPTPQPAAARAGAVASGSMVARDALVTPTAFDTVTAGDAAVRVTTDLGDLLGTTPQLLNLGVQRRNPIVNDPRVRGSRVGSLAAAGSYWVPARIDLDTPVSKLDSRIIAQTTVIPGPYSALYGPSLQFIDVDLLPAPRYAGGFETHGQTIADFNVNGEQWYGRQSVWGGDDVWGFRGGYGHRTGNDYESGNGTLVPSSYKSRDVDVAVGAQLTPNSSLDGSYLRLDQTDVELPGQAFDIDWLKTDAGEFAYRLTDGRAYDDFTIEGWYNRTVLMGSAQRSGKRQQFPFYDAIRYVGVTDVESMSTGYKAALGWRGTDEERLIAGADLRYVKQELNEISSGRIGINNFRDRNSPIPRSHISNPGLFTELTLPMAGDGVVRTGGRVDWNSTNIDDDPDKLARLGIATPQSSARAFLGSDQFDQDDLLGAGFLAVDVPVGELSFGTSLGYGERAPNLTERYAIEPFMFLIQNGLNTVTGDPLLDKERLAQIDVRASGDHEHFRHTTSVFHAWAFDYITFENTRIVRGLDDNVEQVKLRFVNTDLATLAGAEFHAECDLTEWVVPFANLRYVEGTDRTRNGQFATREARPFLPSAKFFGLSRGAFRGDPAGEAGDEEPLPGIIPLETRLGFRMGPQSLDAPWGLELYARVVDAQDRVAVSLLETPTPGFTVWDVRGFVRPRDGLMLVAGVENFTDKQYQEHLDFRAENGIRVVRPGIGLYLGTELTY